MPGTYFRELDVVPDTRCGRSAQAQEVLPNNSLVQDLQQYYPTKQLIRSRKTALEQTVQGQNNWLLLLPSCVCAVEFGDVTADAYL